VELLSNIVFAVATGVLTHYICQWLDRKLSERSKK
jgi:hypothetical protein